MIVYYITSNKGTEAVTSDLSRVSESDKVRD